MSESSIARKFLDDAARRGYATAPVKTTRMPPGIPYIVLNEAAERFSYYGMTSILTVFMASSLLLDGAGHPAPMAQPDAKAAFHLFVSAVYFTPFLGAVLSDAFLGKYRTVFWLSIVYCLGHASLSMNSTRLGLGIGLALIALGSGGIKPCVSSNVGDQFGASNEHLMTRVFGWFYLAINIGAFFSQLWIPSLLANPKLGPPVAFGVPGILMLLATLAFWSGRKKFVHIPPSGGGLLRDAVSKEGRQTIGRLAILYIFFAVFWSLYYQTQSEWILQAARMDRHWL
ncbi:MAG: MFS transporter, partial [Bryobacteraceae bacterium]